MRSKLAKLNNLLEKKKRKSDILNCVIDYMYNRIWEAEYDAKSEGRLPEEADLSVIDFSSFTFEEVFDFYTDEYRIMFFENFDELEEYLGEEIIDNIRFSENLDDYIITTLYDYAVAVISLIEDEQYTKIVDNIGMNYLMIERTNFRNQEGKYTTRSANGLYLAWYEKRTDSQVVQ